MVDSTSSVFFTRIGDNAGSLGKAGKVVLRPDASVLLSGAPLQLDATPRQQTAPQQVDPLRGMLSN